MIFSKRIALAAAVSAAVAAPGAFATNGYLPHGIGSNAKSMGGVGIALPQDAMAAATNPAGQALIGNKMTLGMDWFRPFRAATRVVDTSGSYRDSDSNDYFMPEFGYATSIGTSSSLGVVLHGAGLGVDYGTPWSVANAATGVTNGTNLKMTLKYMYISPTWAMKIGNHAFGASLNIVKGGFEAAGLQAFRTFTTTQTTSNLTDQGEDSSSGIGVKLGWVGELTPVLSMGATWQPKTNMSKFGRYKELFAEEGDADIPEQYGLGIAWKATPATTVGADIVSIKWSGVKSFSNSADVTLTNATRLGQSEGLGFGWKDQTVYKIGVSHQIGKWTLRAGYNYGKSPVVSDETMFNTIAPAVTETHYTFGFSKAISNSTDIALTYMYSPSNEVKGSGTQQASGLTNPDLKMNQNSLGVSFNVKM